MTVLRGHDRRDRNERRLMQAETHEGWDGGERRSKTDRRRGDRRGGRRDADHQMSPTDQATLQMKRDREEKERIIAERKKEGRLRKEFGL